MRTAIAIALLFIAAAVGASTRNNDDSCDIGVYPAATLLLPYFEVETVTRGVDTFFTVTNVSPLPQIAHVTIWTDWSFPVLNFNLFLTGYDVQSISMYDVIVNGIVAPTNPNLTAGGTSSKTIPGTLSASNDANASLSLAGCDQLPGLLGFAVRAAMQSALVTGTYNAPGFGPLGCGTTAVGSAAATHRTSTTAVGYVTVDVTSVCTATMPTNPSYYASEILFDNVLIGEVQTLDKGPGSNFAGGNPMVHIRAIPEGGKAGTATPLPYTFYGRFINGQTINGLPTIPHLDRRQPLGSTFAARWIQGGTGFFSTDFKIWREGVSGPVSCSNAASNSALPVEELERFDEHENPNTFLAGQLSCVPCPLPIILLPPTVRTSTAGVDFPVLNSPAGDSAGWMYLNLDSRKSNQLVNVILPGRRASQNWVVVSMTGAGSTAGLFGVEFDATSLGNGCSPPAGITAAIGGLTYIGPAPNANP